MNPDDFQLDVDAMEFDKNGIDFQERYEETEKQQAYQQQQELQLENEATQAKAELDDPREREGGGGLRGVVKEVQSAIGGGLQDTASSVVTLPERAIDMFSGEMQEEQETDEGYGAEWDDWFVDDANPIETKTWWGGALRSLVHFGSLAAAIIPAAKVAGVTAATTVVGSLARGAAVGAASDVVSKYSQEDNGLAILRDRFNFIDTPLATKDTDHPAMKTLKNVVEGMGIGVIFDSASMLIGKGVKKVKGSGQPIKRTVSGKLELPDTRGKGKFYHGTSEEIPDGRVTSVESGENLTDTNLYGNGFYTTEDLTTASKYKKKNKNVGKPKRGDYTWKDNPEEAYQKDLEAFNKRKEDPITYEITEKSPVQFIDADQKINWTADTPEAKTIKEFLAQTDEGNEVLAAWEKSQSFSYGDITNDLKDIFQRAELSRGEVTDFIDELNLKLKSLGYGGLTHKGGNLAGKGNRLHQVKIYWDAENQIDINKVDFDSFGETEIDGSVEQVQKAVTREADVEAQIREKAVDDLQTPNYTAYKNKDISDPWQGAPTSNGKAGEVRDQLNRIEKEAGAEMGSSDSVTTPKRLASYTTPVETELMVRSSQMAEDHVVEILGEFMTDARLQTEIQAARKQGKTLAEIWGDSAELIKEVYEGRNRSDITPEEFWARMFEEPTVIKKGAPDEITIWDPEKASASRLIIGSLMRELRDAGIGARELADIADLSDIDGPAKAIYEKIIAGLTQIKLSSMKTSGQLRAFGAGKQSLKQLNETVNRQVAESIDAFRLAFKVAGDEPSGDLFKAYMEVISMSNDIRNVKDFDNWVRKKLKGGDFNGQAKTGVLIKELEAMMIHSVLSGPKTSVRAIMGTGTATFLRPISQVIGSTLTGDVVTRKASISALTGMIETIPEAWKLFNTKLNAYWSGDISTIKSRYIERTKGDEQWAIFSDWVENSGRATLGDKAAFYMANMARSLNDNKFLTYSTKIMAATDDTFGYLLARAKGKEKAMRAAIDAVSKGDVVEITPDLLKNYENRFLSTVLDPDGNITDAATLYAKKEATLTQDLTGFAKGLNDVFEKAPWAKPFFLFARTGVNGLALTAKHTPGFNFLVKEYNEIAGATVDNLQDVAKYGIKTAEELANAKALQTGRLAMGGSIITMASMHFMNGGLTGNGPADRQMRRAWIDGGYKPRTITIGGVQVGYDSFEPFNLILSTIADIGDYSQLMGEEWTEDNLQKLALVVAQGVTSKSYLAGMQQFVDLFGGSPGQTERIVGGLMNNIVPMSSMRNELGKLFNPHMKELNAGIWQSIRNRNLITEGLAVNEIPTKYDLLNGKPIRDWDFPTRMFNMFSPFSINLDQSEGRKLLFESKYDMRLSTLSSPDGLSLKKSPRLRSLFQKAIGDQNLEAVLNRLARDPRVIQSLQYMQGDLNAGRREMDPRSAYVHNQLIHRLFQDARKKAWAKLMSDPEVIQLITEQRRLDAQNLASLDKTANDLLLVNR